MIYLDFSRRMSDCSLHMGYNQVFPNPNLHIVHDQINCYIGIVQGIIDLIRSIGLLLTYIKDLNGTGTCEISVMSVHKYNYKIYVNYI
jgi:hypothetical protein